MGNAAHVTAIRYVAVLLPQADCLPAPTALQWRMPALTRQKITFAEMRAVGVRGLLV
jgi:hypothetical protein